MPVFNNILAGAAGQAGGAAVAGPIKSVRFNSDDDSYLDRTPSSAGNRRTWTWSAWVKRCAFGVTHCLFFGGATDSTLTRVIFGNDTLELQNFDSGTFSVRLETNALHRDPAAWYHFTVAVDTTQATAADRVKMYVNGVEQDSFLASTYPTQNQQLHISNNVKHSIGLEDSSLLYYKFDGYMADVFFIDGQQLEPTDFGAFDDNGVWQAAAYSGTFGTNGFHLLDFANESTVGHDSSGNENDWTANYISTTAGADNDVLFDVPTNGTQSDTGAGGEVSGCYATLNPLNYRTSTTYSNGNLQLASSANYKSGVATIGMNGGKYYFEGEILTNSDNNYSIIGVTTDPSVQNYPGAATADDGFGWYSADGQLYYNDGLRETYSSYTVGDIVAIAYDSATRKCWIAKNGFWENSGDPAAGTGSVYTVPGSDTVFFSFATGTNGVISVNFGARSFNSSAPSGFKALCTTNLPTPTIADGSDYFDAKLYTGNGSTQTISGLGFSPDLVWIKNRAQADNHKLLDTVRGATKELEGNTTDAEVTNTDGLTAFNSDGFDLGADDEYNTNTESYVTWTWDAGSSTASNTDGSITSSVRANQTAGFSIVTYTGTGSAATIGHGINAAPEFILVKRRDAAKSWIVYHASLGNTVYLNLDRTDNQTTGATNWNSTDPTSSVFSVGGSTFENGSSATYVAYCFAPVAGYSAFGSYAGNGSTDGPFVYTGFRPKLIMVKRTDSTGNWVMMDSSRDEYNYSRSYLEANDSAAEGTFTGNGFSLLSNGFKLEQTTNSTNASGGDYIYMAFAENPFQANGGLAR